MKQNFIKYTFSTTIFLIVVILGYYYLREIKISAVLQISTLNYKAYIIIIICFVVSNIIVIIYNSVLLTDFNCKVSAFKLAMILWVSQTSNYLAMAKVGLPVRIVLQKKLLNIPYTISISTKLIVSWFMLITVAIAGITGSVFSPSLSSGLKTNIITGGLIVLGMTLIMPVVGRRLRINNIERKNIINKIFNYFVKIYTSVKEVSAQSHIITFSGILFRSLVVAYVSFTIINTVSDKPVNLLAVWAIQAVNSIVSLLSFVPLGLGTKDLSLIYLFSLAGVGKEEAVLLAAFERIIWTVIPFILGIIGGLFLGLSNLKLQIKDI